MTTRIMNLRFQFARMTASDWKRMLDPLQSGQETLKKMLDLSFAETWGLGILLEYYFIKSRNGYKQHDYESVL